MSRMPRFHKVFTINYTINATDLPQEELDVPQAADYRAPKINNLVEPLEVRPEQSTQPGSRVGLFYSGFQWFSCSNNGSLVIIKRLHI